MLVSLPAYWFLTLQISGSGLKPTPSGPGPSPDPSPLRVGRRVGQKILLIRKGRRRYKFVLPPTLPGPGPAPFSLKGGSGEGIKSCGDWALAFTLLIFSQLKLGVWSGVLKILRWSLVCGLWPGLWSGLKTKYRTTARPLKNPGPLKGEIVGSGEEVFSLLLCFSDCNYFFLE